MMVDEEGDNLMPCPICQNNKMMQPCSEEYPQKPLPHPPTLEERYAALQEEAKSLRRELALLFRDYQDLQLRYEQEKGSLESYEGWARLQF